MSSMKAIIHPNVALRFRGSTCQSGPGAVARSRIRPERSSHSVWIGDDEHDGSRCALARARTEFERSRPKSGCNIGVHLILALISLIGLGPLSAQTDPPAGLVKVVPSVGAFYEMDLRHPDLGFRNPDGSLAMVQTYPEIEKVDYASLTWQRAQIESMMEASLDFLVPNWKYMADQPEHEVSQRASVSLKTVLQALVQIGKDGGKAPRIAVYVDGMSLKRELRDPKQSGSLDLREDAAFKAFEDSLFQFFRSVPKSLRWELDGYPLILIGPAFGAAHDKNLFDRLSFDFQREFKAKPYLLVDASWQAQASVRWQPGAALLGPQGNAELQFIGPGYDDTRIPGRGTPIRKREDGRFYEWSWNQVLLANPTLVLIDSWNRFSEGSGIALCEEYGDFYIDLTRRYVARLKGGILPDLSRPVRIAHPDPIPRPDEGWFTMQDELDRVFFVAKSHASLFGFGLRLVAVEDGPMTRRVDLGQHSISVPEAKTTGTYLYCGIADEFAYRIGRSYEIEVVCQGQADTDLQLQYDSWDQNAAMKGAYKSAPSFRIDSGKVLKVVWQLPDARFSNRQNGGADFRLFAKGEQLEILGIQVRRLPERLRSERPILLER